MTQGLEYDPIKDILTLWDGSLISNPRKVAPVFMEIWRELYSRKPLKFGWTKRATEKGFYVCVVDGLPLEDGEIHFIDPTKEPDRDYENLWLFGPFAGYPTTNYGIINA